MPIKKYPEVGGAAEVLPSGAAFPASPDEGDAFYRTDLDAMFVYDGAAWVEWEIETHAAEHQSGGADELNVGGLAGDLADAQDPKAHVATHQDGGADEIDAAELAGGLGTVDQVLTTDGAACSWQDPAGGLSYRTMNFSSPRVTLNDGESVAIARFVVPAGKTLNIWKAQCGDDTGATVAGLEIEAYNNTDAVSIYSLANSTIQEGAPLASGGVGDDVTIQINNGSGGAVDCQGFMAVTIE